MVKQEVKLRIVLEKPPPGVDFGLQKGSGSNYETVGTQRSTGEDLQFECSAIASADSDRSTLRFSGPYVQGSTGSRFLYVDIGTYAGQKDSCWSRRLKIPLAGIPSGLLTAADPTLEARICGTGEDQTPSCGTANPFPGWTLRKG